MYITRAIARDTFKGARATVRKNLGHQVPEREFFGFGFAHYADWLARRSLIAEKLRENALHGVALVCHEGRRSNGEPFESYYEIPATVVHYLKWRNHIAAHSDNNTDYFSVVSWFSHDIPLNMHNRGQALWGMELDETFFEALTD